ncbi:unnamed protein product [Linum tenue]|uniref:Uncharacterized protein n=1 Tax=Linum tenue TaxID=586396 RepID=A0AAV0LLN4_9ROSI|nr:unnamed protein product [Linum tenue]
MSCFNFRLPPAKKAWKSFTNKLRSKLHNPKPMKFHPPKHSSTALTFTTKPYGAITPFLHKSKHRKSKQQRGSGGGLARALLPFKRKGGRGRLRLHYLNKSCAAPVFVDNLFKVEPPNSNVTEVVITRHCCGTSSGKSTVDAKANGEADDDDDMWESMGISSPLMTGIDERAEEFISSFRAEMQVQERIARTL